MCIRDRFRLGAAGAGSCNLSHGTAEASVSGYMDDSDPSNIDALGHRSWCVFPSLKKTGFGASARMTAMHTMDRSGAFPKKLEVVCYPPAGYVPRGWFGPRHAWSVWVIKGYDPPDPSAVRVTLEPVGADFLPSGDALAFDHEKTGTAGYGIKHRVVFRPRNLDVSAGRRYRVTINGLTRRGREAPLVYYVAFYESPHAPRVPR